MTRFFAVSVFLFCPYALGDEIPRELRVGHAGHAFDHLGAIGDQVEAAAASGATVAYMGGLGTVGYQGFPAQCDFDTLRTATADYCRRAKSLGIELNIGYLCATSIVKLDTFDKNWPDEFRARFKTPPAEWRQQDRNGQALTSWYGGDYTPACMSNPDWRAYERQMVREQIECGHDGIFFDNPTVHPQGCYCPHCMRAFAEFIENSHLAPRQKSASRSETATVDVEAIRKTADKERELFLQFRSTTARDFLKEMRGFARTINPKALVTCNNSLNSPGVFYSQCRLYGYNIQEMSKVEDYVVVEDMASQPRIEANGQTVEYGPMYKMLHTISHGRPIVAVTLVGGDYHTPPNLVRLAMAEATAHNASYLSWPTWPEDQRQRMIESLKSQADFLRRNADLFDRASMRDDFLVFLPFRRWVVSDECAAAALCAQLTQRNIQYRVISEDDFHLPPKKDHGTAFLLAESRSVFSDNEKKEIATFEKDGGVVVTSDDPTWTKYLQNGLQINQRNVRIVVHDQPNRTIAHLYNLNVERVSSFEDKVTPAVDVRVELTVPFSNVRAVRLDSADHDTPPGPIQFASGKVRSETAVSFTIPRLAVSAIAVIEP